MNPLEIIMLDDEPNSNGNHLYPEQRAQLFESWWSSLSREAQKELADANSR